MSRRRLEDLRDLSGLVRDAKLAKVEAVMAQLNALQADIARLRDARAAREAVAEIDAARLSGADVAWMAWVEGRLRELQRRHAGLRVAHETALAEARTAFGRSDVLARLARDAKARR